MSTPSLAMIPAARRATQLYSQAPNDGTGDFTVARASKNNEINSDLKLEIIANDVPAFNFDTIGGCPVLNTEPQATNLITYPITFSNAYWTLSGATLTGSQSAPSVDFPTSAFKLVEDTSTAQHVVFAFITVTAGVDNTESFYFKKCGRRYAYISTTGGLTGTAIFDLESGVVSYEGASIVGTKITTLADGWYRCDVTANIAGTSLVCQVGTSIDGTSISHTGDGISGIYMFMGQVEQGSFSTSPTFTDTTLAAEGSTTTRLAESVSITNFADAPTDFPFAIYTDVFIENTLDGTAFSFLDISVSNVYFNVAYQESTQKFLIEYRNGAVDIISASSDTFGRGWHKVLAYFKSPTEKILYVNGTEQVNDTHTFEAFNSNVNDLLLGQLRVSLDDGSRNSTGDFLMFNSDLTASEMVALTS